MPEGSRSLAETLGGVSDIDMASRSTLTIIFRSFEKNRNANQKKKMMECSLFNFTAYIFARISVVPTSSRDIFD